MSTLLSYRLDEEAAVRRCFPQVFHKVDRQGRPVQYFLVGDSDPEKLATVTSLERLLRWNVHRAEHTIRVKYPRCSQASGKQVSASMCIIDLENAHMGHFCAEARAYMKLYFELLGNNFPGNLGKVMLINCPMLFTGVWSVASLFLPEVDRERIQLFGGPSTYEAELRANIDAANLPTRYGGTDPSFSPYQDVGPWDRREVQTGDEGSGVLVSAAGEGSANKADGTAVVADAASAPEAPAAPKGAPPAPPAALPPASPELV